MFMKAALLMVCIADAGQTSSATPLGMSPGSASGLKRAPVVSRLPDFVRRHGVEEKELAIAVMMLVLGAWALAKSPAPTASKVVASAGPVYAPKVFCAELQRSAATGDVQGIQTALAKQTCDIDQSTDLSITPLHEAAAAGHVEAVVALLNAGAIHMRDAWGQLPAHMAAAAGHSAALEKLVAHMQPAQLNHQDDSDETPLVLAGKNGHEDAARVLLKAGADLGGTADDEVPATIQMLLVEALVQ
mmetsp:Transcript_13956/g.30879  ORF Transcript_13956/g.30879 Transcript_13956/m.30879 type:complete len:245 (-) Transcript_13956:161-895(-)|eukprot:CAMPEP_0204255058 /NCGR_PEP_ID=MMETSP0468-20130131/2970_1 /ASSEMBLY_ACC=CAM_ASM_000383 /TAXON_ID=2969 /ORGANISM="Oxyrrhis marina" /LENGTH=244 /DNA_ID=CAMNT_0051228893 /DNA_START=28 /DNA_END=762 /DNA_ORIENTATION=-